MGCGTKEQVVGFEAVKERTLVLDVGDAFDGHASVAVHGYVCPPPGIDPSSLN